LCRIELFRYQYDPIKIFESNSEYIPVSDTESEDNDVEKNKEDTKDNDIIVDEIEIVSAFT
jgi:hypothetical protein